MKRIPAIIIVLFLMGTIALSQSGRRRPQPIVLKQFASDRIIVHHVPNEYFSANVREIAEQMQINLQEAERTLGAQLQEHLQLYLFSNWEEKGNFTSDARIAHADPDKSAVYSIINTDSNGLAERPEYQVLLRKAHGPAFIPEWEEYTASALGGIWFQKKLEDWQIFLKSRKLLPTFPELFNDPQTSRFIRHPWNASFIRFIKDEFGLPAAVDLYKTGRAPAGAAERWRERLEQIKVEPGPRYTFRPEFQKGISYAYWNSYDAGYATKKSKESLERLRRIGVEWVASIPYGYMPSNQSLDIRFSRHHIAGENDESLWVLAQHAKNLRMKVMLKPQIWIRNSWPGNISFESPEEWNLWLDHYEKWILHYAIIAELTDASLFCVGTEFVTATLNNPRRWREIIKNVRHVYSGPLTYAANWGKEFENIEFWDALDYMGLDNYYPVRGSNADGAHQMKAAFARQKSRLEDYSYRYCRPLLFTEIGYMANSHAGMGPEEYEADPRDYDEMMQKVCYRLALETYWNEPWFAGMYWWKWFSEPNDRGRDADAHSPHGRPAERVLAEWYRNNNRD